MRALIVFSSLAVAALPLAAQQDSLKNMVIPPAHYIDGVPVQDTAPRYVGVPVDRCRIAQLLGLQYRSTGNAGGYAPLSDQSGDRMGVHLLSPDHSAPMPSMATGSVQDRYPQSSPIKCQPTPVTPPDSVRKP